jgi:hypothetical protein
MIESHPHPRARSSLTTGLIAWSLALCFASSAWSGTETAVFNSPVSEHEWTLSQLNPALPSDWDAYDFLVLEFRASSSQRFELGLRTSRGLISKKIHPFANVWVRASVPLRFFRQGLGDGVDLAATVNQPRNSYWINIEGGGNGPTDAVLGLSAVMRYPVGSPTLEIRSVTLSKTDPGDAILDGNPLVDEFGQYTHADWPGKAHSAAELREAWAAENAALASQPIPSESAFGGFENTHARATGFFRVERIDGRWWLVTPDGHLFYSAGVNGVGPVSSTRTAGREAMFSVIPTSIVGPSNPLGPVFQQTSFYSVNLGMRYGADWQERWAEETARRFSAWGLNTSGGTRLSENGQHVPYVLMLRDWQTGPAIMGLPDVYAGNFEGLVQAAANRQLAPRAGDPWMVGYFIGNEPPWPGREGQFVDLLLSGPATQVQARLKTWLAGGDTPERRKQFVLDAFSHYLAVINVAVKRADPNHLNLGIRFGGSPPDDVIRLARGFDVYSFNKYRYAVPSGYLDHLYSLVGLPMLIGEFHIGVPGRGMAPGLVQAMNQAERGVAYRYYVEQAASHPAVIGTHWFAWLDEPVTGRSDGENYNIGWIDVTDRPYPELVEAAKATHARLYGVHSGKVAPFNQIPRASDVGSPADASQLGVPAIQ